MSIDVPSTRAVQRWQERAEELHEEATLMSASTPTSAQIREAYEREADAKDARDANRTALLPGGETDDGDRITDEGETRFFNRKRPAPHKPPVPIKSARPTMLGGMAGAPRPIALGAGFEPPRNRDTLTPTEPGAQTIDARIERLWLQKIAAAQEAGKNARHCHGPLCMSGKHLVETCSCGCDGCELVVDLLITAQREITGRE
jgi:hypothetical protein